jgi:chemotaxis protein MotA
MNLVTIIGFFGGITLFIISVFLAVDDVQIFLDFKSGLIVFGGTIAATLVCFPLKQIVTLLKIFFRRMFGINRRDYLAIIAELAVLARARLQGKKAFDSATAQVNDFFLKEGAELLFWAESEIDEEELRDILTTRMTTHFRNYTNEAKVFRTVAKFPPAFGLLGTALGMVALLSSMSDPNAKDKLGPAMAIALVTTIYGIATANLLFTPVAENLSKQTEEDLICRTIVVEGLMLINAEKSPRYIEEKLKSYLLPSQRAEQGAA